MVSSDFGLLLRWGLGASPQCQVVHASRWSWQTIPASFLGIALHPLSIASISPVSPGITQHPSSTAQHLLSIPLTHLSIA